jgi:hypothetical protein
MFRCFTRLLVVGAFCVILTPLLQAQNYDEKLTFSHKRGFYAENFDLTLSTTTPGLTIKYTKDGTNPLESNSAKSGISPLTIRIDPSPAPDRDTAPGYCVRAVAVKDDTAATKLKTHTFLFYERIVELSPDNVKPGPDWPDTRTSGNQQHFNYGLSRAITNSATYRDRITPAFVDIPSISMVLNLDDLFDPGDGIYVNAGQHGIEWERPCSIELLHPDGSDGFQVNAGVRIRGGYSRSAQNPKHAFRYFFREEYGDSKLEYPLFGDEGVAEFDKVDLRTSQNYSWSFAGDGLNTMNRDVFSRDTQRDMGQPYTRSRYYHLYINGTYWGLFQTQERSEAAFGESYFGGDRDDYDVVKVAADQGYVVEATDGTLDTWRAAWEMAKLGFADDANYYRIQGKNPDGTDNPDLPVLIDIDNLIDYNLITFVTGNYDAPISNFLQNTSPNNFYAVYNRNARDGFRFFQHDGEHTMRDHEWARDRTGPFPAGNSFEKSNPQWFHQQLVENPKYRARVGDRVRMHYLGDGALTQEKNIERFLARKEEIDLAIIAESARWGDSKRSDPLNRDQHWLNAINWIVEEFFPDRTDMVLQQVINKGWYPIAPAPTLNTKPGLVEKGFRVTMQSSGDVYYTLDGSDPYNPSSTKSDFTTLFPRGAAKRAFVPTADPQVTRWRAATDFDDSAWMQGSGAVGYENGTGYENNIKIDVGDQMVDKQTSCYIRIPFTVNMNEILEFNVFQLNMLYDDGFVAFLNGTQIAQSNAPQNLAWNAQAEANHEADAWETFTIPNLLNYLKDGDNVLAIQALNVSTNSSDFIFDAEFQAAQISNMGAISETAVKYDNPLVVNETTRIKARATINSDWSAATDVTLYVFEGLENLKFTEIHYHPMDNVDSLNDDSMYEFVELKNIGNETLDVGGVHFRGIQYTFPQKAKVEPGGFVVLAQNVEAFQERYGFAPTAQFVGKLDNNGETLAMISALGDTLTKFRYNDKYPWPQSADGKGYSIVAKDVEPVSDENSAASWVASSVIHGTPGSDDSVATFVSERDERQNPQEFALYQNYPNPFNPKTTIKFALASPVKVQLSIYNILGQRVAVLLNNEMTAGVHAINWNAENLAGGLYFYHLQAGEFSQTKKLTLVK